VGGGLRYNEGQHHPGAQTERRGVSRPVRLLLGGEDPPAAFSCLLSVFDCGRGFSAAAATVYYMR